jgi:hypothetical protein
MIVKDGEDVKMFKLSGCSKKYYSVLLIGAAALSLFGINNIVSAYNDAQSSRTSGNVVINEALPASGFDPGSPLCNPAGCAACRGCTGAGLSQTLDDGTNTSIQVSLTQ